MSESAVISAPKQVIKDTSTNEVLNKISDKEPDKERLQRFPIQTKLTVGAPDDPYEKEADETANAVMQKNDHNFIQKKTENGFNHSPAKKTSTVIQRQRHGRHSRG